MNQAEVTNNQKKKSKREEVVDNQKNNSSLNLKKKLEIWNLMTQNYGQNHVMIQLLGANNTNLTAKRIGSNHI
jgi:hypothetical protein